MSKKELSENQKKLLDQLNDIRNDMDTLLEDESVTSLPKQFDKIKKDFDNVLAALEDGDFEEDEDERDDESSASTT